MFFQFQCQVEQLKIYSKTQELNFIGLYRLMRIQKHLNHSIWSDEVNNMKSLIYFVGNEHRKKILSHSLNSILKIFKGKKKY